MAIVAFSVMTKFQADQKNYVASIVVCRNKVQAELKVEIEFMSCKEFSVVTLLKKNVKKTVVTLLTPSRH